MMKSIRESTDMRHRTHFRIRMRKLLSGFLAVSTAITMLGGSAATLLAEEPSTEYALAGAGTGEDITIHFGDEEDKSISVHVNPESNAETLAGLGTEAAGDETESETENTGLKEVKAGGFVTISSVDETLLPEEAEASAEILNGKAENTAVEKVEEVAGAEPLSGAADPAGSGAQDKKREESVGAKGASEADFAAEAVEKTEYQVFDISLDNVDEKQYQDGFKVEVSLPEDVRGRDFKLYHIHEGEEPVEIPVETVSTVDPETGLEVVLGFEFTTDGFSEFVLQYTVDFHYEINGKMYEFGIPGGGFVSFADLVEILGIAGDANSDSNKAGKTAEGGAAEAQTTDGVLDVTPSDAAKKFVEDVESVEFSSPELVWVGKANSKTTVGSLKEANGLECEYSAELTEEQIDAINGTKVESGDWALISLEPFLSEESLTVTMKDGEVFTIRVTDAQIKKTVIDAKGDTWEITVTYDNSAEIPSGAELKVREILPEDEKYNEYYQQSMEKVGVVPVPYTSEKIAADEAGEDTETTYEDAETASESDYSAINSYAHIFDIQIWDGDHEIQPASDVSVSIKLLDAPENDDTDLKVVHFGKDGLEVMELIGDDEETDEKAGEAELSFVTDEFSVYSVVNVTNSTDLVKNGPWALVTGVANDPGATTGYNESWGTDYFTIIVNAEAMRDTAVVNQGSEVAYVSEGVHAWTDGSNNYVGGDAPEVWNFERVHNSSKYYIYVLRNGVKYYIDHHYGNQATTSLSTRYRTEFDIVRNSDGTICICSNNNWYLGNNGNGEWSNRDFRFTQNADISKSWFRFRLCKKSDDFESFAAHKVAASLVTTNSQYVIYRKFEDELGNEALFALAHDGTFVRVYDGGDTIYWRETDKNLYWNYQMDNSYPVLFTQDPVRDETIYINPNHSMGQTLSTVANGLTLQGKDNGEYGTTIECWDQVAYDYAGLHVTLNDRDAALSTGTRVAGTSDEFLFAEASHMPGATAETVDTVDSDSLGIKITMFDYGNWNGNYAAGDKLSEMTTIAGSADYTPHAAHALVKPYLESGLPSGTNGAMTGLFGSGGAIRSSKSDVNHLFLQSYYDESGTFRYRSEDNYAYLPFSNGQIIGTDFTVYRQAATPYTTDYSPGHTYYYHGHFMPYNDIDMNNNLSRLMNQYGNEYTNGKVVGEIPLEDGRTYEDIYGIQGIPNFYTGMKMEAKFTQPRNGNLANGDNMVFKFTGDDDMWVYIDGILVLDIGGIHEPLSGTINFATGTVTNPTGSSLAGTRTLKQIFMDVKNASNTPQAVKNKIDSIVWKGDTFADYTNHDFKAFYMERGAGASNLDIQFNLKVTLTNEFTVEKELPENVDERFANQTYKFRATYMDNKTERGLHAGITNVCTAVVYKDRTDDQGNPVPVEVNNDGYFNLKAGEVAVFKMADESIRYNVKEVDIDENLIEQVAINGQVVTVSGGSAEAGYTMVEDRTRVSVTNHPKTQNLLITKHLTEDSAPLVEGENPVFEFRVYLETTVGNERKLIPYSYGPYYLVKMVEGEKHYFTLTGDNNAPEDKGKEQVVCSTTGRSGSINSIPPEYTIIIPELVVGTNFYVEERLDNIPIGYGFVREKLTEDTYEENDLGSTKEIIEHILPRDQQDKQEFDPQTVGRIKQGVDAQSHVYNKKLSTEVILKKVDKNDVDNPNPSPLYGAAFKISKYPEVGSSYKDPSWGENGSMTLQDEQTDEGYTLKGEFTFEKLTQGYYVIDEIAFPPGYVQVSGNPSFQVTLNASNEFELTIINNPENLLRLVEDEDKDIFTIIVGNTPGVALPATGGPGTRILTILGIILILGAGVLLWRKRRLI